MFQQNQILKKIASCAVIAGLFASVSLTAQASSIDRSSMVPLITSGALPDTPAAHEDPNTASSAFSGVVSINIVSSAGSFICSGALVGKRSVVSAGHCVDQDGNGHLININAAGNTVRVVFNAGPNLGPTNNGRAVITASAISMNPNYAGFGNCPAAAPAGAFCLNDDVAVVTLSADAPPSAKIYRVGATPLFSGQHIIMAGYGTSGDGTNGFYIDPSFRIKRVGENNMDLFDNDDEQGFAGGPNEVWYADFDGAGKDTFCRFGVCDAGLGNSRESGIGGGDSGGPSFYISDIGEYVLIGNNTFGSGGAGAGKFGSNFGGMVLSSYQDYLNSATHGEIRQAIPEPASIAMLGLGLAMLLVMRRRSKV